MRPWCFGGGQDLGSAVSREGMQAFHPGVLQQTLASPWAILKRDG